MKSNAKEIPPLMHEAKQQVEDVNFFGNTVVVKFADGALAFLEGAAVREASDAQLRERVEPFVWGVPREDEVRAA